MLKKTLSGVCAGLLISLGGSVFLACENRYVGAVLFCVALICICFKGFSLYTGKVGYIPEKHDKDALEVLLWGLLGNVIGTFAGGFALRTALPNLGTVAESLCAAKLNQTFIQTLLRSTFCGMLMYLAVSIFRDKNTVTAIVFCIPAFILSGFEHSIADMFYFSAAGIISFDAFVFLLVAILGNGIGGMLLPLLSGMWKND